MYCLLMLVGVFGLPQTNNVSFFYLSSDRNAIFAYLCDYLTIVLTFPKIVFTCVQITGIDVESHKEVYWDPYTFVSRCRQALHDWLNQGGLSGVLKLDYLHLRQSLKISGMKRMAVISK